jgi:hypothetical protein
MNIIDSNQNYSMISQAQDQLLQQWLLREERDSSQQVGVPKELLFSTVVF